MDKDSFIPQDVPSCSVDAIPLVLKVHGMERQTFSRRESASRSFGPGSSGMETFVDDMEGSQNDSMNAGEC